MKKGENEEFFESLRGTALEGWLDVLPRQVAAALGAHGNYGAWVEVVENLPQIVASGVDLLEGVRVGSAEDCDDATRAALRQQLMQLHPWRKGPFELFGLPVETEWRSDWKWDRLVEAIAPLDGRRVLDVGCGNGYHCWRMMGREARQVIGIDPMVLYVMQFQAIKALLGAAAAPFAPAVHLLPVGIEALPEKSAAFDSVFSMGVLYHRRSPFDHLYELRHALHSGGELILETLVIDGAFDEVLVPQDRYAQMRNVWFIPSVLTLESWLKKVKFRNVRLVDVTATTVEEQRSTEWMTFNSLADFLHPDDPRRTIEGHPAPLRAIFVAEAP